MYDINKGELDLEIAPVSGRIPLVRTILRPTAFGNLGIRRACQTCSRGFRNLESVSIDRSTLGDTRNAGSKFPPHAVEDITVPNN